MGSYKVKKSTKDGCPIYRLDRENKYDQNEFRAEMIERELFSEIDSSVKALIQKKCFVDQIDTGDWRVRFIEEPKKFLNDDFSIRKKDLKNFRDKQILVPDRPYACFGFFYSDHPWYRFLVRRSNRLIGYRRHSRSI